MRCWFFTVLVVVFWPRIEAKASIKDGHPKNSQKMNDEEIESLRQKATDVIQKMERQLQDAYTDVLSTEAKSKKVKAEHKLEELISQANAKLNKDIKGSTKGLKVEIMPVLQEDALQPMVSIRRTKRSGVCSPYCQHKCLPSCNLACCVPPPHEILTKEVIEAIEQRIAKKIKIKHSKKDKITRVSPSRKSNGKDVGKVEEASVVRHEEQNQKRISKEDLEKGEVCEAKCRVLCEPTCKFKCCIATYKGSE